MKKDRKVSAIPENPWCVIYKDDMKKWIWILLGENPKKH